MKSQLYIQHYRRHFEISSNCCLMSIPTAICDSRGFHFARKRLRFVRVSVPGVFDWLLQQTHLLHCRMWRAFVEKCVAGVLCVLRVEAENTDFWSSLSNPETASWNVRVYPLHKDNPSREGRCARKQATPRILELYSDYVSNTPYRTNTVLTCS